MRHWECWAEIFGVEDVVDVAFVVGLSLAGVVVNPSSVYDELLMKSQSCLLRRARDDNKIAHRRWHGTHFV